jgi:hypothetical protein
MQGKRLGVDAAERIANSTPVSVEYNDAMFLGEVLRCSQTESGSWDLEIKVEQILTGLQSLMKLRAHLIGEKVPQAINFAPVAIYS